MLRKPNIRDRGGGGSGGAAAIRTRRAYFEMRFGQMHVRTAFPATGGFDEQLPLFCVHPSGASGREFGSFLAAIAAQRSVYAPDLPGCGESDPAPAGAPLAAAAAAIRDLAADLRLRRIDLLAVGDGAAVALEVAAAAPDLVRRLVLVGAPAQDDRASITQPRLVLATDALSPALAQRVAEFLDRP